MFLLSLIINLEKLFPENPNNDCLHFATKMFSFQFDVIFFFSFFFSRRTQRKNWRMEEAKTKQKVKELETNIWYWRKSRKKSYEQFFYLIYYYYNPHQEKSLQAPFFVMLGHTPNIFRLILCTNILQEDSDWSTQFQFPPIKFQEISRYSQMNQWEARSRTTIHFFKIFRLWPSNL